MENIKALVKKYDYGKKFPYAEITRPAINYIHSVKCYGWEDKEHVNGYQCIKWVKVTVEVNDRIQTIWNFRTVQEQFGKVGYIVDSWCNQFERQVSKKDGNIAYMMIMEKAKEIKGVKIIIETLI